MEKNSLIKELIIRRVPQIVGLYIAATWMMIEIGDWMVERFSLATEITSYIFIGMACFIPSVFYLAYQYGKPGHDPWRKGTFTLVPGNLLIAIVAMNYLVSPVIATETKLVIDENGVQQSFEIPKAEFQLDVINFFWKNSSADQDNDWLQFAIPWLLTKDLDRSLFISSYSPFMSRRMVNELRASGFDNGLNAPRSLQLSLARNRFAQYMVAGEFNFAQDIYQLTVDLIEVDSGNFIANHQLSGKNLLELIDGMSSSIKKSLKVPNSIKERSTDLAISEHISESLPAIKDFIQAKTQRHLQDDYLAAKQSLENAIEKDFSFAYALTELAMVNFLIGNTQEAQLKLKKAMQHEYKFSAQNKFFYKAMAYRLRGDYVSQIKVYDMWLELYPDDIQAHESMAEILLATGIDLTEAEKSLFRLRELKPNDDSVLRMLSKLFILQNKLDKAALSLEQYIQASPGDSAALVELADIYNRTSNFELARETLQRVTLLEPDNTAAGIMLANLDIKFGDFSAAETRLSQLLEDAETQENKFEVLVAYLPYYIKRGQIEDGLLITQQLAENSQHLPPMVRLFSVDFQRSILLAFIGQFNQAESLLQQVKAQLQSPMDGVVSLGFLMVNILQKDIAAASDAIDDLKSWLTQYPNPVFSTILDTNIAQFEAIKGEHQTASELYEKALSEMSNSAFKLSGEDALFEIEVRLAEEKFKAGQVEAAEKLLLETIKRSPVLAYAHLVLAKLYHTQNNDSQMQASLEVLETVWANADKNYFFYRQFEQLKQQIKNSN